MYKSHVPRRADKAAKSKGEATTRSPRRSRGRPAETHDGVGQEAILNAAEALLRELPPAKVTRAAVARQAGVDPGLIRYYFKDRSSLLLAVVRRVVTEQKRARASEPPDDGDPPSERLRAYILRFFKFNFAYPFVYRLLVEEINQAEAAEAATYFQELNSGAIHIFNRMIKAGVKDGSLRRVDPMLLHVALIGMSEFFHEATALLQNGTGKRDVTPQAYAKRYAELVSSLVVEGLATR